MRFFRLKMNPSPYLAGHIGYYQSYDSSHKNAISKLNAQEFPDFEVDLPILSISSIEVYEYKDMVPQIVSFLEGIASDFLHDVGMFGGQGFIISEKVKDIMIKYRIGTYKLYDLQVLPEDEKYKKIEAKYYYIQLLDIDYYNYIDFEASLFYYYEDIGQKRIDKNITFKNTDEFLNVIRQIPVRFEIYYRKLKLKKSFLETPFNDLFILGGLVNFYRNIISERLMQELKEKNVTGLEDFKEVNIEIE